MRAATRFASEPLWENVMKRVGAIALALVIAMPAIGFTHGTVGDYTFLEPIVADDANPKNEFAILHPRETWTEAGRQFSLGFALEKVIVAAPESLSNGVPGGGLVSIEIGSGWNYRSPRQGAPLSGFDDLEILPKWAFLTIPEHEFRLSIGVADWQSDGRGAEPYAARAGVSLGQGMGRFA